MHKKTFYFVLFFMSCIYFFNEISYGQLLVPSGTVIHGASKITKVTINYSWWGAFGGPDEKVQYVLLRKKNGFVAQNGIIVEVNDVIALGESLVDLQPSGNLKECYAATCSYPSLRVELEYDGGTKVILYSNSSCRKGIPWNVVYKDKLYVQYTGEFGDAVYPLLYLLDTKKWKALGNYEEQLKKYNYYPVFSVSARGELPVELKKVDYSEAEVYRKILSNSPLFIPFLTKYRSVNTELTCYWSEDNVDCSSLNGVVYLRSTDNRISITMHVVFKENSVKDVSVSFEEWKKIEKAIYNHPLFKKIDSHLPNAFYEIIHFWKSKEWVCNEKVFNAFGLSVPSPCSYYSIGIKDGQNTLLRVVYLPDIQRMLIEWIRYGSINSKFVSEEFKKIFEKNRELLDPSILLGYFKIQGFESFAEDTVADFQVSGCGLTTFWKKGILDSKPDFVKILRENGFSVYMPVDFDSVTTNDYCVFVNENGGYEPIKAVK